MIDREYKKTYENLFNSYLETNQPGSFDEAAFPSYTHQNPLMASLFWKRIKIALKIAEDLAGCNVLDFGAGGGVTFKYLADRNCSITACENRFYKTTEEIARRLNVTVKVYRNLLDIDNEQFDRIFALDVFEHIDNPQESVKKLIELSKENTRIIISGPTENWLYKIGRKIAGFSGHYHLRNIYDIEQLFEQNGLKCLKVKQLYPLLTLFRVSIWKVNIK
jgi:2-polyprenyl-3-methyl-5-hydroxy-6-metoxy-1,4-benzoquinol methylase